MASPDRPLVRILEGEFEGLTGRVLNWGKRDGSNQALVQVGNRPYTNKAKRIPDTLSQGVVFEFFDYDQLERITPPRDKSEYEARRREWIRNWRSEELTA